MFTNLDQSYSPSQGLDGSTKLVTDIELVRVEEQENKVDPRGKPLEHFHVVVTSDRGYAYLVSWVSLSYKMACFSSLPPGNEHLSQFCFSPARMPGLSIKVISPGKNAKKSIEFSWKKTCHILSNGFFCLVSWNRLRNEFPNLKKKIYTILVELHPGIVGELEQFKYMICYMQLTLQGA